MAGKYSPGTLCVHCGEAEATTADHVPPKSLFPKGTTGLITVPSCQACNQGDSSDDEYLRNMVVSRKGIGDRADAQDMVEAMRRSLLREEQKRLRDATLKGIATTEKWSRGVLLGRKTTYEADIGRMARVIERTIKGLYWYHFNAILPVGVAVQAFGVEQLDGYDIKVLRAMRGLLETSSQSGLRQIGGDAFEYSFGVATDDSRITAWNLRFWGEWFFLGATLPEDMVVPTVWPPPRSGWRRDRGAEADSLEPGHG